MDRGLFAIGTFHPLHFLGFSAGQGVSRDQEGGLEDAPMQTAPSSQGCLVAAVQLGRVYVQHLRALRHFQAEQQPFKLQDSSHVVD